LIIKLPGGIFSMAEATHIANGSPCSPVNGRNGDADPRWP